MKQRSAALIGPVAAKMWVSTFPPPACASCAGTPTASTTRRRSRSTTRPAAVRLTGYVIRDLNLDPKRFPPQGVHATISAAKNDLVGPRGAAERAQVILRAQGRRRLHGVPGPPAPGGAMDFDDLLLVAVELFPEEPDVLERYRARFRHILVDEYQDTNRVQERGSSCSRRRPPERLRGGDSDQSIYQFRGADIRNILPSSRRRSPTPPWSCSEQNYRSTQTILDAAKRAVIANNLGRKPKSSGPTRAGAWPSPDHADDEGDEAQWVAHEIARLHDEGRPAGATWPSSTARTPRAGWWRRPSCGQHPHYKVIGGTRFYDRREVKGASRT